MRKKYIICSTPYDERWGGVMVLHNICNTLNRLGEKAYLCPIDNVTYYFSNKGSFLKTLKYRLLHPVNTTIQFLRFCKFYLKFKTNKDLNTPVISPWRMLFNFGLNNYIILYAEIVDGNPIGATNVTRLLMHNPGHFSGRINYGNNELMFRYSNSFARDFTPPEGSLLSDKLITVSATPPYFKYENYKVSRKGIAYCIRKGKGKTFVKDHTNDILIDNMSLREVAEVFNKVEMFISYDPITAFSNFSLLCHCPSVIILGENETKGTYRPESNSNSHYAYSIEEANTMEWDDHYKWAKLCMTKSKEDSTKCVKLYIEETQKHFK